MAEPLGVRILASLREEVKGLEQDVARGKFTCIEEFAKAQGMLFGVERALELCKRAVHEDDDA